MNTYCQAFLKEAQTPKETFTNIVSSDLEIQCYKTEFTNGAAMPCL